MPDEAQEAYGDLSFVTEASVTVRAANPDLIDQVKALAPDASVFNDGDPFIWDATISNDRIDYYFTRMHKDTLKNYAEDSESGVAFLDGHNIYKMALGRSFGGKFTNGAGEKPARVDSTFYTIPDRNFGGTNTSDFIAGVKAGIHRDVSVGFTPGYFMCNLCEGDPFNWFTGTCMHVPGLKYDAEGKAQRVAKKGSKKEDAAGTLCFAWVMEGRLREVSTVYKGATPGASITKVRLLALRGELDEGAIVQAERQFRIQVPRRILVATNGRIEERIITGGVLTMPEATRNEDGAVVEAEVVTTATTEEERAAEAATVEEAATTTATTDGEVASDPPSAAVEEDRSDEATGEAASQGGAPETLPDNTSGDARMSGEQATTTTVDQSANLRAMLAEFGHMAATDPMETMRAVLAEHRDIKPRAEVGDHYFDLVVERTIKAGAQAMGEKWDEDAHRAILNAYPRSAAGIKLAESMEATFTGIAQNMFSAGSRRTTEGGDSETPKAKADVDPISPSEAATYRSGR